MDMSRIHSKDTQPELRVRSLLHRMGFRFRLHRKDLPGSPDIVLPKHGLVIFVHGCFWHRHEKCKGASQPKTHMEFWQAKLERNMRRDQINERRLVALGWRVLTIWECQTRDLKWLFEILSEALLEADGATL